jgi:HEAT repeat protein
MLLEVYRKSKFPSVRKVALNAIEDMAEAASVRVLGQILNEEKDARLRRIIVRILGETGNDDAVPILLKAALEDEDYKVRAEAVSALSEIDSKKSRAALVEILKKK